jgi:DNA polymerase I
LSVKHRYDCETAHTTTLQASNEKKSEMIPKICPEENSSTDELTRFYPQTGSYDILLKEDEHVSDAINRGDIRIKNREILSIESPTSSGKGYFARYLLQHDKTLLLCVDNLRKLVLQTFNRLMPHGNVIHYERSKAIKAAKTQALCICLPSIKESKNVLNYFLNSTLHKDMKVNIVLDEIHLIAKELFNDKQLYPKFLQAIRGRVNKIVTLTATMTDCSRVFLKRLSLDLEMDIKFIRIDRQRKKLPGIVYKHKSKVQKIDFIIKKLQKHPRKVIIIDQSRTFIEELEAEISKQLPDKKTNIVTANTDEEYDPVAVLTLGSPSMSTGISIDEKVSLFVVGFNDNVATPESYEQTLARLRNEKGQNWNTEICILAQERENSVITSFVDSYNSSVKSKLEALDDINMYLKSSFQDDRLEEKLKNRDLFLLYNGEEHFYDPDYLKIQSIEQAEHQFTRKIGALAFLKYFENNPHILSGVEIKSIVTMPEPQESDVMAIRQTFHETKERQIEIVKSIEPCRNYAERRRASNTLKEEVQDAESFKDLWLKILKHEAITVGVQNLELMPNTLRGQIERKRPVAIINSWFFLKDNDLIKPGELKPEYLVHLQIRRERYVLLYKISEEIWQLWQDFHLLTEKDFNLFATNLLLFLKINKKGSLDMAFGGSEEKTLVRFRNTILSLLGVERQRTGKLKTDFFYRKDQLITLENGYDYATLFFWCQADSDRKYLEKSLVQAECYEEVEGILHKNNEMEPIGVFSARFLKERKNLTCPKRRNFEFELVDTEDKLVKAISMLSQVETIGLDTETTGLDPHHHKVRLLQVSSLDNPVFIFDLFELKDYSLIQSIIGIDHLKIFHNAKFDLQMLKSVGLNVKPPFFDTMIVSQLLAAGLYNQSASLQSVVEKYLGIVLDKQQQVSDWSVSELSHEQLKYAMKDVQVLLPLFNKLGEELESVNLLRVAQIEFDAIQATSEIEYNGMLLDQDRLNKKRSESETRLKELELELTREFNYPDINLNSPQQIKEVLNSIGIEVESTGKYVLIPLAGKYPILAKLLEYRKLSKLLNSFLQKLPYHINPVTSRIHPNLWQVGAVTGRFACSNPNLQQIPRDSDLRSCFIAEPGHKIIVADYGQIELKVLAEITQDKKMIEAFNNGIDLHTLTASLITQKDVSEITKEERLRAKAVNFGLSFGMGSESLRSYSLINYGVSMTEAEAREFKIRFFNGYPGLAYWHDEQRYAEVKEIHTLSGRRRLFADRGWFQALLNTPVQGSAADIVKRALGLLPQALNGTGAKIIGTIHDEILLEAPDSKAAQAAKILESTMIKAGEDFIKSVPIEVDISIGDSWDSK